MSEWLLSDKPSVTLRVADRHSDSVVYLIHCGCLLQLCSILFSLWGISSPEGRKCMINPTGPAPQALLALSSPCYSFIRWLPVVRVFWSAEASSKHLLLPHCFSSQPATVLVALTTEKEVCKCWVPGLGCESGAQSGLPGSCCSTVVYAERRSTQFLAVSPSFPSSPYFIHTLQHPLSILSLWDHALSPSLASGTMPSLHPWPLGPRPLSIPLFSQSQWKQQGFFFFFKEHSLKNKENSNRHVKRKNANKKSEYQVFSDHVLLIQITASSSWGDGLVGSKQLGLSPSRI